MKFNLIHDKIKTNLNFLVGFNENFLPKLEKSNYTKKQNLVFEDIICLENLLSVEESKKLQIFFNENKKVTTRKDTIKIHYGTDSNGILRSCFYDKNFAISLSKRVNLFLNKFEVINNKKYELIGINPLIRFISYQSGHKLIPHYDIPVNISENVITLKTLVLYLTRSKSGSTNFLIDTRVENKKSDSFNTFPILFQQLPEIGLGIIFNHEVFHEGGIIDSNDHKLIMTTEICYKEIII